MKILIADDEPISRLKLASMLQNWGYEVVACTDGLESWEKIQAADCPDLLILDWMMPGLDGPELCRKIRQLNKEPYTYVLLLTARNESEDIIEGMDAGADDYITKPFSPHELKVRLRAGRRIIELTQELMATRDILHRQATYDNLTGLLNRPAILERLRLEITRRQRHRQRMWVILLDIDHFKKVNDTHGHQVGDEVLRETAHRLTASLRPYDNLGRYGGEEFLIVTEMFDSEGFPAFTERLRHHLSDQPFLTSAGPLTVTASFGVGIIAENIPFEPEALIALADGALYRAKHNGRNRVEMACRTE